MPRHAPDGGARQKPTPAPKPALAPAASPLQRLTTPPPAPKKVLVRKTAARSPAHTGQSVVPPPKPLTAKQAVAAVPVRQITSKPGQEPPAPAPTRAGRAQQNRGALRAQAKVIEKTNDKHNPLVPKLVKAGYLNVGPNDPLGLFSKTEHDHVFKGPKLLSKVEKQLLTSASSAGSLTPVAVKALDTVTRPAHAIFGGIDAAVKGGNVKDVQQGVKSGIEGKTHVLAGQVLKDAGVKNKYVQAIGGTAADIVLDPTTYFAAGAGTVAERAALKAGRVTTKRALKAGISATGAKQLGERAAADAAASAPKGRGIKVAFSGHEVPGVRRATAATGRVLKKVTPSPAKSVGAVAKDVAREVRPQIAPAGVNQTEHTAARAMARRARATTTQTTATAGARARGLEKQVGHANYVKVMDAIERNDLSSLDPKLADIAHREIRSQLKGEERLTRRAGVTQGHIGGNAAPGEARGYFPHARQDILEAGHGVSNDLPENTVLKGRARKLQPSSSKERTDRRPVSAQNPERVAAGLSPFSTDLPLVFGNYATQAGKARARGHLIQELAASRPAVKTRVLTDLEGKPITRTVNGKTEAVREPVGNHVIGPGEQLYHVGYKNHQFDIRPVKDEDIGRQHGKYVILNKKLVEKTLQAGKPAQSENVIARGYDRMTAGFKRVATGTPAFQARNAVGDTQMGYLEQPGHLLPRNAFQAGKALKRLSAKDKAVRNLERPTVSTKTIKVAGTRVPVDEFLKGAVDNGVIHSGLFGRELTDLAGRSAKAGAKGVRKDRGGALQRGLQNREDLMRLATYKSALDRGLSSERAADVSLGTHIDYGELTDFERNVMRRVAPFYTFTARGLPIHAKALVKTPGKFANINKVIEEIANATGLSKQQAYAQMQPYEQQQTPAVVGKKQVSAGLPLSLLNDIPDPSHPVESAKFLFDQAAALANPLLKDPLEIMTNRSFFTHQPIVDASKGDLTAAPFEVKYFPAPVKKLLGVTTMIDRQSGKRVLAWSKKSAYAASMVPGLPAAVNQIAAAGSNQRGQSQKEKIISKLTGVNISPINPTNVKLNTLFSDLGKVSHREATLRQQGVNAAHPNREYTRLLAKGKTLTKQINTVSVARGDKNPYFKRKGSSGGLAPADKAALSGGAASLSPADKAALNGDSSALSAADKAALNGG